MQKVFFINIQSVLAYWSAVRRCYQQHAGTSTVSCSVPGILYSVHRCYDLYPARHAGSVSCSVYCIPFANVTTVSCSVYWQCIVVSILAVYRAQYAGGVSCSLYWQCIPLSTLLSAHHGGDRAGVSYQYDVRYFSFLHVCSQYTATQYTGIQYTGKSCSC